MDIFPLEVAGVKAFAKHDGGSDVNCHPEQFRKMIEAHNATEVQFHALKVVSLQGSKATLAYTGVTCSLSQ